MACAGPVLGQQVLQAPVGGRKGLQPLTSAQLYVSICQERVWTAELPKPDWKPRNFRILTITNTV